MVTRILFVALMIFFLVFPAFSMFVLGAETAYAADCAVRAGGFVPLECFQGPRLEDIYNTTEFAPFLQKLFVGAISLGAIIAVLRLAYAGFVYMGTDMWGQKEHAKEIIRDTLLGLFLLLAIWLILKQINPDILKLKITAELVGGASQTITKTGPAPAP